MCDATRNRRTACLPTLRVPSPVLCTVEKSEFLFISWAHHDLFQLRAFLHSVSSRTIFHHLQPIFISLFRSLLKRELSLQLPWRLCTAGTLHQSYWPCCAVPSATSLLPFVLVKNISKHNNGYLTRALPHCQTKVETATDPLMCVWGACTAWTHCSKDASCPTCYGKQAEESHHTP